MMDNYIATPLSLKTDSKFTYITMPPGAHPDEYTSIFTDTAIQAAFAPFFQMVHKSRQPVVSGNVTTSSNHQTISGDYQLFDSNYKLSIHDLMLQQMLIKTLQSKKDFWIPTKAIIQLTQVVMNAFEDPSEPSETIDFDLAKKLLIIAARQKLIRSKRMNDKRYFAYVAPPIDLTTQGVEPNPGPCPLLTDQEMHRYLLDYEHIQGSLHFYLYSYKETANYLWTMWSYRHFDRPTAQVFHSIYHNYQTFRIFVENDLKRLERNQENKEFTLQLIQKSRMRPPTASESYTGIRVSYNDAVILFTKEETATFQFMRSIMQSWDIVHTQAEKLAYHQTLANEITMSEALQVFIHDHPDEYQFWLKKQEDTETDVDDGWERELKREGVEENPGPIMYARSKEAFINWCKEAIKTDINHHQSRSRLLETLNDHIVFSRDEVEGDLMTILQRDYIAISTILGQNNREVSNDAFMNFKFIVAAMLNESQAQPVTKGKEGKQETPLTFRAQSGRRETEIFTPQDDILHFNVEPPWTKAQKLVHVFYEDVLRNENNLKTHLEIWIQELKIDLTNRDEFLRTVLQEVASLKKSESSLTIFGHKICKIKSMSTKLIKFNIQQALFQMYIALDAKKGIQPQMMDSMRYVKEKLEKQTKKEEKVGITDTPRLLKELNENTTSFKPAIDDFNGQFKRFNDNMESMKSWMSGMAKSLPTQVRDFMLQGISMIATIIAIVQTNQTKIRALLLIALGAQIAPAVIDILVPIISEWATYLQTQGSALAMKIKPPKPTPVVENPPIPVGKEDGVKAQMSENGVIAMTKVFLHMFASHDTDTKKEDLFRINVFKGYASAIKTIKDLTEFLLKIFKHVLNHIYELKYGYPYDADIVQIDVMTRMSEWINEVNKLFGQDHSVSIKHSKFRTQVEGCYVMGHALAASAKDFKMESARVQLFMQTFRHIEILHKEVVQHCKTDHGRPRPLVIMLLGLPNAGKSVLTDMLLKDLCDFFGWSYSANAKYLRNIDETFWSAYFGQVCTIFDDPFQDKTTEKITKTMKEFIHIANNQSYPLEMPDVESKGKTFFDSRIVIVTGNDPKFDGNHTLESGDAFRRRFDMVLKVIPVETDINGWTDTRYTFQDLKDYSVGGGNQKWFSITTTHSNPNPIFGYSEFVEMCAKKLMEYGNAEGNIIEYLMKQPEKKMVTDLKQKLMFKAQMKKTRWFTSLFSSAEEPQMIPISHEQPDQPEEVISLDAITHTSLPTKTSVQSGNTIIPEGVILKPYQKALIGLENFAKATQERAKSWAEALKGLYKEHKIAVVAVAAIPLVALLIAGVGLVSTLTMSEDEEEDEDFSEKIFEYQSNAPYEKFRIKRNLQKQQKQSRERKPSTDFRPQGSDRMTEDLVDQVLPKQCATILIKGFSVQGTFVEGRFFITVFHQFRTLLTRGTNVSIFFRGEEYVVNEADLKITHPKGLDITVVEILDKKFPQAPSILKHWMRDEDLEYVISSPCSLAVYRNGVIVEKFSSKAAQPMGYIAYEDDLHREFSNADSYIVSLPTKPGDCGSPYLIHNTKSVRKIFGIHVAGNENTSEAVCCIVTAEDLEEIIGKSTFKAQSGLTHLPCPILPLERSVLDYHKFECSNVEILGTVPSEFTTRQPSKSEIIESPFHNAFGESEYAPAMLGKDRKSGVSPFEVGLQKKLVREKNHHFEPKWKQAVNFVLSKMKYKIEPRMLTEDEAINGVKGWYYINGIDTSTSPGWPYNKEPQKKRGKMSVLEGSTGNYRLRQDVHEKLLDEIACHRRGERTYPVVNDQLKDELLKQNKVFEWVPCHSMEDEEVYYEKLWIGNTRVMNALPIHNMIEERMCTGAFVENIMRSQPDEDSFCDLGVDYSRHGPFLAIFKKLARRQGTLKAWQQIRVMAGDFSKQDATEGEEISRIFREIMKEWYRRGGLVTEEDLLWIDTLDLDLSHVTHLAINLLYRTWGNPSGRVLTTVKNSFVTLLMFLFTGINTWLNIDPKLEKKTMNEVFQHVYEAFRAFGDDHLYAMAQDEWFDMFDVQAECAKWGLIYTSCFKDQELVSSYPFSEVKYLQRYFTYNHGICRAALDKSIIEDTPYWMKLGLDPELATAQTLDSALREAALWGPEYFHEFKEKYNHLLRIKGYPLITLELSDLEGRFFSMAPVIARAQYGFKCQSGQVNDADRKEMTSPLETVVTTTTFADNVGKQNPRAETPILISPALTNADPYEDQGMSTTLSRPYPVASFIWQGTDTMGTLLNTYDFPKLLFDIPNLQEKLNRFEYLQSAVRVSIRLNATTFHSGKLMVAWLPHYKLDNGVVNVFQNIYTASSLNSVVLSANTTAPVDFIIPYVAPSTYWDMKDDPATVAKGWFGTFAIYVLAPLALVGATVAPSLAVNIYANFEQPKVAGLGLRNTVSLKMTTVERRTHRAQLGGIQELTEMEPKEEKKGFKAQMQKEANVRSESNTISAKAETTKPSGFGKIISNLTSPLMDMGTNLIGEVLTGALGFLNKPTSTQAVQKYVPKSVTTFANASGLDGCEKLALDPENKVSVDNSIYADKEDYSRFSNYKLLPSLILLDKFTEADVIGSKILILPITPTMCFEALTDGYLREYLTMVGHLSSYFQFWRGSIKVHIMFTCSRFTTARVRITWLPDPKFTASIVANEEGDTVNKIVDITGDTSVSITIPYLKDTYWTEVLNPSVANFRPVTQALGFNGQLIMTIVNPAVQSTDTANTNIYMAVWISGGEDFEVAKPSVLWSGYTDGTVLPSSVAKKKNNFKAQSGASDVNSTIDMRAMFKKSFETLVPAKTTIPVEIHMGEKIDSWITLLKRYSYWYTATLTTSADGNHYCPYFFDNVGQLDKFSRILRSFNFLRGSYRIKALWSGTNRVTMYMSNWNQNDIPEDPAMKAVDEGITIIDTNQTRWLEAEVPYYCKYAMIHPTAEAEIETLPQFRIGLLFEESLLGTAKLFLSAGDDFSIGCPLPPVPIGYYTSSKKKPSDRND